jgi:hypothetical protein
VVNGESVKGGALALGALAMLAGIGLPGCGESSRAKTDASGAASGVGGLVGSSGGGTGVAGAGHSGGSGGAEAVTSGRGVDAGGIGGDAGDAGAPGSVLAPVRVIRGDPEQWTWWDLTLQGVELAAYEGKIATARIGDPKRAPERLGSGQARVEAGEFSLFLPDVWEEALYKDKRAYLDVNENGRCDTGADLVFHDARATPDFVLTLRASDANTDPGRTDLRRSTDPEADCAVFNATWPTE